MTARLIAVLSGMLTMMSLTVPALACQLPAQWQTMIAEGRGGVQAAIAPTTTADQGERTFCH